MQSRHAHSRDLLVAAQQRAGSRIEICERDVRSIRERPPLRRQYHAARMPLKKRYAERSFEPADVMADRARREMQLLRGVCKILMPGCGRENREGRQHGGADGHETRARFVTGARS